MPVYCFIEISAGFAAIPGKIIFELFDKQVPKAVENFRALCTGEFGPQYQDCLFHRVIETFTIQGGDTDGDGGSNIYKEDNPFQGEDLYWRDIDEEYLVCMADAVPRSQFFITLRPSPHLNGKHCCIGKVIRGQQILQDVSRVKVDDHDKPIEPIKITRCGELEYKGPKPASPSPSPSPPRERQSRSPERQIPSKRNDSRDHDRSSRSRRHQGHRSSDGRSKRHRDERSVERRDSRDRHRKYDREEEERIRRQEMLREYDRVRRSPGEKPDVVYKGRGKMSYRGSGNSYESKSGRLA